MAELPLHLLFARLSQELAALTAMASEMEAAIDDLVESNPGILDAGAIRKLQLLDVLKQSLLALSRFAADSSMLTEPQWRIDADRAVAGLTLSGLAHRLAQGRAPEAAEPESYELFSD